MVKRADMKDLADAAALGVRLWPGHTREEMEKEFFQLLSREDAQIFLKFEQNRPVGFAQCQLRRDYVEGTSTSPVGYLEGIFVEESRRGQGIARELLAECEAWAREKGCTEFASDCELENAGSLRFHLSMGFGEANRIICFTKRL
ncbi:MAG: GNAT family N-acetyltransferase [Oscillibacter sp.]|nr:GNAT family N-acetyltransferase [Oscillibacter sp.]